MIESVEEIVELSLLYDFYGELLNEHKRQIYEGYVLNDLSLAEIADEEGISRQGVHDLIKRCTKQMREYESILHLMEHSKKQKETLEKMQNLIQRLPKNEESAETIKMLIDYTQSMMDEL